jgi:pimeloyl-ACP methyl ester carboxylesterase
MRSLCVLLLATMSLAAPALIAQAATEIPADFILLPNPPTHPITEWKDAPGRKAVSYHTGNIDLRGFRYPAKDPQAPEILFFNGNGMTILRADRVYRALADLGYTVTAYDYRGYGFTAGKPHLADFVTDGLKLYDETLKQAPSHKLVVYGASMGTAVAAYVASQRPLAGLILGMPVASVEEEFPVYAKLVGYNDAMIAAAKPSAEAKQIFAEADLIKNSTAPLLVLGGSEDVVVPDAQGKEILAASPAHNKTFVEVNGAGHNDVIFSPTGIAAVKTFLNTL